MLLQKKTNLIIITSQNNLKNSKLLEINTRLLKHTELLLLIFQLEVLKLLLKNIFNLIILIVAMLYLFIMVYLNLKINYLKDQHMLVITTNSKLNYLLRPYLKLYYAIILTTLMIHQNNNAIYQNITLTFVRLNMMTYYNIMYIKKILKVL